MSNAPGGKDHWQQVFRSKKSSEVTWYQPHLELSLELIRDTGLPDSAAIIDVGGGASTLVDDLIGAGFEDVTVLDIAGEAIDQAKARLGDDAARVSWIEADITQAELPAERFDLWHDRAAFHFLTDDRDRKSYAAILIRSLRPGGHAIIATFGPSAPPRCSGLDVVRYTPGQLSAELGPTMRLVRATGELHPTPSGNVQEFTYACFQMVEE